MENATAFQGFELRSPSPFLKKATSFFPHESLFIFCTYACTHEYMYAYRYESRNKTNQAEYM